ncbi:MAG: hypothetical protein AAB527_02835 [Patescibacteria group bacterium]
MLLSERENRILDFLVRDFISTAEPVSSLRIRKGLKLKESPATIRNIVAELDDEGFCDQPHVSSGRVPTDTAYRYFVDNLMSETELSRDTIYKIRRMISREEDGISRFFAETLNLLSFSSFDGEHFSNHGISRLLQEPEFRNGDFMREAGYFIDHVSEMADLYCERAKKDRSVFIGRENPTSYANAFGVFYLESKKGGNKNTLVLVGPKRMDYERVSSYINCFLDIF